MLKITKNVTHGKASTYRHYGCRCDLCKEASRISCKKYRVENKEAFNRRQREMFAKKRGPKKYPPEHGVTSYKKGCRCEICKAENTRTHKLWVDNNLDKMQAIKIKQKKDLEITKQRVNKIKLDRGCFDCGYNKNALALQFDHVRGEKINGVSKMLRLPWEKIEEEIAKCEVRCANCHMIKTHSRD